ncbi:MAG: hypothetical protein JOY56_08155 [Solirubrobacterales bacterium]|nr:hypothetical protein [Solirubrobacterales bacterium]
MARILFDLDIQAPAEEIVAALDTAEGLRSWWTEDLEFPGGVGSTMKPNFPIAPMPFELTVEKVEPTDVAWRSVGEFPPPGRTRRSSGRSPRMTRAARTSTSTTTTGPPTRACSE